MGLWKPCASLDGIERVAFLRRREWWERLDVGPLVALDVALGARFVTGDVQSEQQVLLWIVVGVGAVAVHLGVLLAGFWSVAARARLRFSACAPRDCCFVAVIPAAHRGSPELCTLRRRADDDGAESKPRAFSAELPEACFEFQGEKYALDIDTGDIQALDYPISLTYSTYLGWKGYDAGRPRFAEEKWGSNEFNIPLPSLEELFVEHALSPFFMFQMLCVALWCLDEYWYYSVFTAVMLVLFEVMVCKQRQMNIENLRNMRRPPFPIYVYRQGVWGRILSSGLLPGDVCSVLRVRAHHRQQHSNGDEADQILMPCDVVLLQGSCIVNEAMLTGESVPKMKESLGSAVQADPGSKGRGLDLHRSDCAQHVILGGTRVLQHSGPSPGTPQACAVPPPPDGGCPCFVLRTGFATSQGSLMRTILFSTNRVTVESAETYVFICCLLVFAVVASAYVLVEGLKNEKQSRWKLFLHCTMIITSVVPPELPMELSLAVNTSLGRLHKLFIYCTEPYRIPMAGKLDMCCFDKTGTLTSDSYFVKGVLAPELLGPRGGRQQQQQQEKEEEEELTAADAAGFETTMVLAGCHQLVRIGDRVDGDMMEQAGVLAVGWAMTRDGRMVGKWSGEPNTKRQLRIAHRHPFSSEEKRMSVLAFVDTLAPAGASSKSMATPSELLVLCKGAPEVIQSRLATCPPHYQAAYQGLMMKGARVLALAFKRLPLDTPASAIRSMPRDSVESDLEFAGFLALTSPLKDDTAEVLSQLRLSQHRIMVITGDNALTACEVARNLGIVSVRAAEVLTLEPAAEGRGEMAWKCIDPNRPLPDAVPFSPNSVQAVRDAGHELVVTGSAIAALERSIKQREGADAAAVTEAVIDALSKLAPHVAVFARVSPGDKELILTALKRSGLSCLMCGDGTNDVGALKQADVGVSIVNSPEHEEGLRAARESLAQRVSAKTLDSLSPAERFRAELQQMEREQQGSSVVQLGDASIASPFTSKTTSTMATVHLVRQGRCTLVTTIQMYKILALNCLVSAYSLSALYLYGVKQGDTQATVAGLLIASLFMFIAWAEPLNELSRERPVARIFSAPVMASLAGQLLVHFMSLFAVLQMTLPFVNESAEEMAPDADFKPNVINTAVFLLGLCMQCNVFGANYRGRPFMQSLLDNKLFHRVLGCTWLLSVLLSLDLVSEIGELFELVPIPTQDDYKTNFVMVLLLNTAGSYAWEYLCRHVFKA